MTKSSSKPSLRSETPPAVNTMGVREFMRGGIYNIDQPTVIMSHSTELGTWYPRGQGVTANYYGASSAGTPHNTAHASTMMASSAWNPPSSSKTNIDLGANVTALEHAIGQIKTYLTTLPEQVEEEKEDG